MYLLYILLVLNYGNSLILSLTPEKSELVPQFNPTYTAFVYYLPEPITLNTSEINFEIDALVPFKAAMLIGDGVLQVGTTSLTILPSTPGFNRVLISCGVMEIEIEYFLGGAMEEHHLQLTLPATAVCENLTCTSISNLEYDGIADALLNTEYHGFRMLNQAE